MRRLLTGKSIRMTSLNATDMATITEWYHDGEFSRLLDYGPMYPRPREHWEKWRVERYDDKSGFVFGIRLHDAPELIGWVELDGVHWTNGSAWLGIGIGDPKNRGKGYGHEAMTLILDYAFNELNLHRIQLSVFGYNTRAIDLYERMGFVREGNFREFLNRDGQRFDMFLYGLLAADWRLQNTEF